MPSYSDLGYLKFHAPTWLTISRYFYSNRPKKVIKTLLKSIDGSINSIYYYIYGVGECEYVYRCINSIYYYTYGVGKCGYV